MNECVCNVCGETKVRNFSKRMAKSGKLNYVYTDSEGKTWNGKTCYTCVLMAVNQRAQAKREKVTRRLCRVCNKNLPKSKYFMHADCTPTASFYVFEPENGIYEYGGLCRFRGDGV